MPALPPDAEPPASAPPVVHRRASGPEDPLERHLLPMHATVDERDRLSIGGVDVISLAEAQGTPLFVYDEAHLRARCREAVAAWGDGVAYASKAFLCTAMARLAVEEGMALDVATGGELHVALAAGAPPERLVLHGNNKTDAELRRALDAKVGRIVVDSFDEIHRLRQLVADGGRRAPQAVLVRVTPGIEAHTHAFVRTGQEDSKFGFSIRSGAADRAIRALRAIRGVELVGVHAHIGSQVFDVSVLEKAAAVLAELFLPLGLAELCVGGGLGVAYVQGERAPSITEWADATRRVCREVGVPEGTQVTAEPGRSIVADAAITVYRVGTIKELPGIRTYLSVDGGMSDNPRPVLYGSGYEAFLPRASSSSRPRRVRVVGRHCESGDVVVANGHLPADVEVGDFLATPVTGAYGHSMSSTYNKVPRAAVVFVADGTSRVVVRRETLDDLLALDC